MIEQVMQVDAYFPWFFPTVSFVLGAIVGSFLNVCIYRIPAGESVVTPRSHNKHGDPIAWYDNIPILSYVILRGRDRKTGERYSPRYLIVELLTALLFMSAWMTQPPALAVAGMIFIGILVPASFIDLDHMIIPDRFTVGGFMAGMIVAAVIPGLHGVGGAFFFGDSFNSLLDAVLGAFIGSATIFWLREMASVLLKREAMGYADITFMGCIGAFTGWQGALFAIFGGAVVGCVIIAVVAIYSRVFASGKTDEEAAAKEPETIGEPWLLTLSYERPKGAPDSHRVAIAEEQEAWDWGRPVIKEARVEVTTGEDDTERVLVTAKGQAVELEPGAGLKTPVPFGPMLAIGGLLYFLFFREPVDAYFEQVSNLFSQAL